MPNIRMIDMRLIDDLFQMGDGYVLDFTDRTMRKFFADELNVDIEDQAYKEQGTSKAKRLRCFLNKVDPATAARALTALWSYREESRGRQRVPEWVHNGEGQFLSLLNRIQGKYPSPASGQQPTPAPDRERLNDLKKGLLDLVRLEPQARGYAFERWLQDAFAAHGLMPREPFRLRGEQIDGSFILHDEVYLVEAKWQSSQTGAQELHAFEAKLGQKAAWTRGLFISNSGFTADGLFAFGRGKRVICMDGFDLFQSFDREIPLTQVLERKVRRAGETGHPFVGVRDLFGG